MPSRRSVVEHPVQPDEVLVEQPVVLALLVEAATKRR
jgi:hypothetical protein